MLMRSTRIVNMVNIILKRRQYISIVFVSVLCDFGTVLGTFLGAVILTKPMSILVLFRGVWRGAPRVRYQGGGGWVVFVAVFAGGGQWEWGKLVSLETEISQPVAPHLAGAGGFVMYSCSFVVTLGLGKQ